MIVPEGNYITYSLAVIILAAGLYGIASKAFFQALILHPASIIYKKEYYRIFSSALIHNNIFHLAINLFMFYVFCSGLEGTKPGPGWLGLLVIAGASLLGGQLLSLWLHRKEIKYSCAGASTIVFGFICSFLIFHPLETHLIIPGLGAIPDIYAAIGYLAVMLFFSKKYNKGKVDYGGHLGGGISGILATVLMYPAPFL